MKGKEREDQLPLRMKKADVQWDGSKREVDRIDGWWLLKAIVYKYRCLNERYSRTKMCMCSTMKS